MIGLLLGYWKIGLLGAALIAGYWYVQHEKTKAFEEGKANGQLELFEEQRIKLEAAEAEARATIEQERMALSIQLDAITAERSALSTQRQQMQNELRTGLGRLTQRETEIRNANLTVADNQLVPSIRDALADIRASFASPSPAR